MNETMSTTSKVKRTVTQCKICFSPAIYSYVGVIVCASCKMFFKRNARSKDFQCHFDGLCQITEKNRHVCGYCRMKKCLENGMQVDLLRNGRNRSKLPTISLRKPNRSILTAEQSNLLTNLIHLYDESGQKQVFQHFFHQQSQLPLKMRFKIGSIQEMSRQMMLISSELFRKNIDFVSLRRDDRSILLENSFKKLVGLNCCFVTFRSNFIENSALRQTSEILYGHQTVFYGLRTIRNLDVDPIFFKIFLCVLMFSPTDRTNFRDVKTIVEIQNSYVELTWRYLISRYDFPSAVRCYSNWIRTLFFLDQSISNAMKTSHYNKTIDSLIVQTEKLLV